MKKSNKSWKVNGQGDIDVLGVIYKDGSVIPADTLPAISTDWLEDQGYIVTTDAAPEKESDEVED